MPLVVERSWSLQKVIVSLVFASLAAGIFSIVVLYRDIQLEKELTQVREVLSAVLGGSASAASAADGGGKDPLSRRNGPELFMPCRVVSPDRVAVRLRPRTGLYGAVGPYSTPEAKGSSQVGADSERELAEQLEHERRRGEEREAELELERRERASRDYSLADERRKRTYLEDELEAARRDRQALARAATEAKEVGSMAAKVAGGVVLCTVLWDASFWIGNPFAVPGITDNLVCGGIASALGVWKHSEEQEHHRGPDEGGKKLRWWERIQKTLERKGPEDDL